jgi:hypothetical protein
MRQQHGLFGYRTGSGDFEVRKVVTSRSTEKEKVLGVYSLGEMDETEAGDMVYGFIDGGWAVKYAGSGKFNDRAMKRVAGPDRGQEILDMLSEEEEISTDLADELERPDPRRNPDDSNSVIDCKTGARINKY